MKIKNIKWYLLTIMFFCVLVIIPITLSKYSESFNRIITLKVRKPEYNVIFNQILPDEYQEVEYIETTGAQWFNTGINGSNNIYAEIDMEYKTSSGTQIILGRSVTAGNWAGQNGGYYAIGTSSTYRVSINSNIRKTLKIKFDSTSVQLEVDEKKVSRIGNASSTNYYFFTAGNGSNYASEAKIYNAKIYDENHILIRNFIPCYRKSDNIIGLYDMINKKFYTPAGNEPFSKGEDVPNGYHDIMASQPFVYDTAQNLNANTYMREGYIFTGWNTMPDGSGTFYADEQEVNNLSSVDGDLVNLYAQWEVEHFDIVFRRNGLPKGYQAIEYIESTDGQYIDTGYFASDKTKIEVKYKMELNNAAIFGARKMAGGNTVNNIVNAYMLADASDLDNNIYYYYGKGYQQSTETIDPEKIYESTIENGKATISDMTDIQIATQEAFTMEYSMYLFAFNENNEVRYSRGGTRIYYFRIYENGNLQKYFVPCYRISDNTIGLYDIVNDVFYTNQGTGIFEKGEAIGDNGYISIDGTMDNQNFVYGTSINLTKNAFTREGYRFIGWNTELDGSGISFTDEQEVNELTLIDGDKINLYAQWTPNTYTVTYNAGAKATVSPTSKTVTYGQTYGNLPTPEKSGYTFKGWIGKNIFNPANVTLDKARRSNDIYYMDSSDVEGNFGKQINIQLYDNTTLVRTVYPSIMTSTGRAKITFTADGVNRIFIHFNTDKRDSRIRIENTIEDGKTYTISYNIDSIDLEHVKATISEIQIEEASAATTYEPRQYIRESTIVGTAANHVLTADWEANEYKIEFNPNRNILPNEYVEVGYLETDGNQYINLGNNYPISSDTKVEIGAEFGESWLYGYTNGDLGRYGGTQKQLYTGFASVSWIGDSGYHDYVFDHSSGVTVDDTFSGLSGTPSGSSDTEDIYLFRAKYSTVFVEGRIYYYRQYNNGNLVYDLVPCYRVSDNVAGMYDLVSDTFFTNAGTGSFTTGYRTQKFEYGTAQNLIANSITKTGYRFVGWNTAADGTGNSYTDEQDVNNLTTENNGTVILYAQWE